MAERLARSGILAGSTDLRVEQRVPIGHGARVELGFVTESYSVTCCRSFPTMRFQGTVVIAFQHLWRTEKLTSQPLQQ